MTRVLRTLERTADALLVVLFLLIFVLVLAQVVCRYVFNSPLVWSEELARFLFIWVAMLAWSLGSRRRSHIAVTYFADLMPVRARLVLAIAVQAAIAFFCLLLVQHGWTLTWRNIDLPTVTLGISYAWVYVVVPVGALAVIAYALAEIRRLLAELKGAA